MSYQWNQFQRGLQDKRRLAREKLHSKPLGFISNLLTNIIGKKALEKISKVGGVPGMIINLVGQEAIDAISGQTDKLPKEFAFLPPEEQKQHMEYLNEKNRKKYKDSAGTVIKQDVEKFAKTYGIEDGKEATEEYLKMISKPKNWKGFLTGKEFDPLEMGYYTPEELLDWPEIEFEDIELEEIDFDDEGNIIEKKNIFQKGKDAISKFLEGKHGEEVYFDDEITWQDGKPYIQDKDTYTNLIGNEIKRGGITKYNMIEDDLIPETLTQIDPSKIFQDLDFEIEDPESFQELVDMISELENE